MNFNAIFLKSFRVLLFPFALIYGLVVRFRNWMFDREYFKSSDFNFPLICVGNLCAGGTGKSPMVEYLLELFSGRFKTATLSRGYRRKSSGYILAGNGSTALDIGDEPMQFFLKFPDVAVAVGEERLVAIPQLLHDRPDLNVIILDDAFQHRTVRAGLNILLTEYSNLYSHDFFLPTGDLRDEWGSAKRAQIIVVTKCPVDLDETKRCSIIESLKPEAFQRVYFSSISYGLPYHIYSKAIRPLEKNDEVLLICAIANPKPLKEYLLEKVYTYYQKDFTDHHIFSVDDLHEIEDRFKKINNNKKIILTTEKDAVRLLKFKEKLEDLPIYVLPIKTRFLFGDEEVFGRELIQYVSDFKFNVAINE